MAKVRYEFKIDVPGVDAQYILFIEAETLEIAIQAFQVLAPNSENYEYTNAEIEETKGITQRTFSLFIE